MGSRHGQNWCGQGSPGGPKDREEGSDLGFSRVSQAIGAQDGIQLVSVRSKHLDWELYPSLVDLLAAGIVVLPFRLLMVEKVWEEEMGHGGDAELPRGKKGWSEGGWCCWNRHHLLLKARSVVFQHHLELSISRCWQDRAPDRNCRLKNTFLGFWGALGWGLKELRSLFSRSAELWVHLEG